MKTETWLEHKIRFVEKDGEWWAVLKDIADALDLSAKEVRRRLSGEVVSTHPVLDALGRSRKMLIVNEFGVYETVFESRKKEAKEFKKWVFETIKQLRKSIGLEGFQVFRMMDKEHQKEAMEKLKSSLTNPVRVDFIKANTITNKAVSNMYGYPKMVKKGDMSPDMLLQRQQVLEDTVNLMGAVERFNLDIPVAKTVYQKYN